MVKRLAPAIVSLLFVILCVALVGAAAASNTLGIEYGRCSNSVHYVGTYSGNVRIYRQNFYWGGGYVHDIQWYVESVTGDPTGFDWIIFADDDGYPANGYGLIEGEFNVDPASLPATVGIGGIGSLPAGDYWLALMAQNASENSHYYALEGSNTNCRTGYGYSRIIAGSTAAFSENELWLNVYEDFVTPTATFSLTQGTPMPTLTPTITLTPTPILSIITTLESGAGVAIERTSTYGDRAIVIAICVLIVIMLVDVTTRIIYAKRNN